MLARYRVQTRFAAVVVALLASATAHAAARAVTLIDAVKTGDLAAVRTVLPQTDVNAGQVDGTTALHWAVHLDNLQAVDLLIKAGAKVDVPNRYRMTPLALACVNGNAGIVERLLKAGAQAASVFPTGETPLMTAARSGHTSAAKVLLAHGADVNAAFEGQTALMWAASRGDVSMIKTLLEGGANVQATTPSVVRKDPNRDTDFAGKDSQTASGYRWAAVDPSRFTALTFAV